MNTQPIFKTIILVGGGHSHVLLIRRWAMSPVPGVRLVLVSPHALTPYSGMLPGLLAGHYAFPDMHIDLPVLCHKAGVRFISDQATCIEPELNSLILKNRPALYYDFISIDIGSTPDHSVPGAKEHAIPIKPIAAFYEKWLTVKQALTASTEGQTISVVGGGAGSVEAILAMAYTLNQDRAEENRHHFSLLTKATEILPGYPKGVRKKVLRAFTQFGIQVVSEFEASAVEKNCLRDVTGQSHSFNYLFWCAQAAAPEWLKISALATNPKGFITVNRYLQSENFSNIFACGDIADFKASPLPKAGVYAVRQAPVLFSNLRAAVLQQKLVPFKPQKHFLSLLALGNKVACGSKGKISFGGQWCWRWKNRIDQSFMEQFQTLRVSDHTMNTPVAPTIIPVEDKTQELDPAKRCGGCGGKLGANIISEVLTSVTGQYQPEDAALIQLHHSQLVQTVDYLKAPFDDPYLFGRIAVFHALNDLYAMNANPQNIQVTVTLPFAGQAIQKQELTQLLQGINSACRDTHIQLPGGHSAEGVDLAVGVVANGIPGKTSFTKQGLRGGDLLILSKPLGSGLTLAAFMQDKISGPHWQNALDTLNTSNLQAAGFLSRHLPSACTDVSGFGLLGHLAEMLADQPLSVNIFEDSIPVLEGALATSNKGISSSLASQNKAMALAHPELARYKDSALWPILTDPQTAGGLLAGISPEHKDAAIKAGFAIIGELTETN